MINSFIIIYYNNFSNVIHFMSLYCIFWVIGYVCFLFSTLVMYACPSHSILKSIYLWLLYVPVLSLALVRTWLKIQGPRFESPLVMQLIFIWCRDHWTPEILVLHIPSLFFHILLHIYSFLKGQHILVIFDSNSIWTGHL